LIDNTNMETSMSVYSYMYLYQYGSHTLFQSAACNCYLKSYFI